MWSGNTVKKALSFVCRVHLFRDFYATSKWVLQQRPLYESSALVTDNRGSGESGTGRFCPRVDTWIASTGIANVNPYQKFKPPIRSRSIRPASLFWLRTTFSVTSPPMERLSARDRTRQNSPEDCPLTKHGLKPLSSSCYSHRVTEAASACDRAGLMTPVVLLLM